MENKYEMDAAERFWLGPVDKTKHLVYRAQSDSTQQKWFATKDGIHLDPNYSEWSVRIHVPSSRSLSFVYKTLAILPKSKLRAIYNLIGEYLNEKDNS